MKFKFVLAAVAAAMISTMAQASLISGTAGGKGTVVDNVDNLEWLRLDLTKGQTVAAALADNAGLGFNFATQSQLNTLLDQFFGIYGGDSGARAGDFAFGAPTTAAAESAWNNLFGLTFNNGSFRESLGFYDDGTTNSSKAWFGFNSNPATFNYRLTPAVSDIGVFLVRSNAVDVPEPESAALLGLGLFSMLALRRRKSN